MSDQDPTSSPASATPENAPASAGGGAPQPARKQVAPKRAPGSGGGGNTPRTPRTPPPVDEAAATRNGFIVIAVAVVLGLIIFGKGINNQTRLDTQASVITTLPGIVGPPTSDRNAAPTTTIPGQGTVVSAKPPTTKVAPKDIKVVVANGVDPSKTIAGPVGTKLTNAGYQVTGKVDLTAPSDKTFVYYSADLEAEAKAMAKVLGYSDSTVAPMPKTPPTPLNGAQVLVVVGKDNAP